MTAAGSVPVKAGSGTESVPLFGTMPAHFILKAFLIDPETSSPLCGCFTLNAYTAAMQALEEATTGDFDASHVIDLDGDPANNFLVLKSSIRPLDDALTVTWDGDARICTVSGGGAEDLALRPGDVISWGSWRDLFHGVSIYAPRSRIVPPTPFDRPFAFFNWSSSSLA